MKKLLFFVALTSFMVSHAMEEQNQQARPLIIAIPMITAQTALGKISRTNTNGINSYTLESEKISAEFNQREQRFCGTRHTADHADCQQIKNQAEAETLFNQYKAAFDATPEESKRFDCYIL